MNITTEVASKAAVIPGPAECLLVWAETGDAKAALKAHDERCLIDGLRYEWERKLLQKMREDLERLADEALSKP